MKEFDFEKNFPKKPSDFTINSDKNVYWKCFNCASSFKRTIRIKTSRMNIGCEKCSLSTSAGEKICMSILEKLQINFVSQFKFNHVNRRFDFHFVFNDQNYLLEYDGAQHFHDAPIYHKKLEITQTSDQVKTKLAFENNYFLIRIDYTSVHHVEMHLRQALETPTQNKIYVSKTDMYKPLLDFIDTLLIT